MSFKTYFVYILTTKNNRLLYIGITNSIERRVFEHKSKLADGYTTKYNVNKLIYYEIFQSVHAAIEKVAQRMERQLS